MVAPGPYHGLSLPPNPERGVLVVACGPEEDPNVGQAADVYADELLALFWTLQDHGVLVNVCNVHGGRSGVKPSSDEFKRRYEEDQDDREQLEMCCISLDRASCLQFDARVYDAVVVMPGDDLPNNELVMKLVDGACKMNKFVASVGTGLAALVAARRWDQGEAGPPVPLLRGKRVCHWEDGLTRASVTAGSVPFSVEEKLHEVGAVVDPNGEMVVRDGRVFTAASPRDAAALAQVLLEAVSPRDERWVLIHNYYASVGGRPGDPMPEKDPQLPPPPAEAARAFEIK